MSENIQTLYKLLSAHQRNRRDGRKLGLVIQGGGMRAVYSSGAIATLINSGLTEAFDHIVGSSAGAINGAYFMGIEPETMLTYTDDITNKNFINFMRREKKVDVDYFVDIVLKHKRPVDIASLLASQSKLHIVMTDAHNGRKVVISDHHKFAEIYEEFRATAALPMLYDKKVEVGGRLYVDGGVADILPVDVAVKLGCTDIVVIMTQQIANYRFDKRHGRLVKQLVRHFGKNQPPSIRRKLPTDERMLQANLKRMTRPTKQLRFYVLQPSDPAKIITLGTIDKKKVADFAHLGVNDTKTFLHLPLTSD